MSEVVRCCPLVVQRSPQESSWVGVLRSSTLILLWVEDISWALVELKREDDDGDDAIPGTLQLQPEGDMFWQPSPLPVQPIHWKRKKNAARILLFFVKLILIVYIFKECVLERMLHWGVRFRSQQQTRKLCFQQEIVILFFLVDESYFLHKFSTF